MRCAVGPCLTTLQRLAMQTSTPFASPPAHLEGQLAKDEEVEGDTQGPDVGLPPPVALPRAHLGGWAQGRGRGGVLVSENSSQGAGSASAGLEQTKQDQ